MSVDARDILERLKASTYPSEINDARTVGEILSVCGASDGCTSTHDEGDGECPGVDPYPDEAAQDLGRNNGFLPQTPSPGESQVESENQREKFSGSLLTPEQFPGIDADTLHRLATDRDFYAQTFFQIRTKEGHIIPFTYNRVQHLINKKIQEALQRGNPDKHLLHKYRRGGITTMVQGQSLAQACQKPGQEVVTMADEAKKSRKIFGMVTLMYESIPEGFRPFRKHENRQELVFPHQHSSFTVGTAGALAFGRGDTLQRLHGSEVAFWIPARPQEVLENLMAGVEEATSHGQVILESTANGASGWWYDTVMEAHAGRNEWNLIFLPWFIDQTLRKKTTPEEITEIQDTLTDRERWLIEEHQVTPQQIKWRRMKKSQRTLRRLFPQEYPETVAEAFLSLNMCFFDYSTLVDLDEKTTDPAKSIGNGREVYHTPPEEGHEYVMGIDPAEGLAEGDPSFAGVLDRTTGKQVAWIHGRIKIEPFIAMCVKMALLYNRALIICERENHGHAAHLALTKLHRYHPLYYGHAFDRQTQTRSRRILGWSTNRLTRNTLIGDLRDAMNEGTIEVQDRAFLEECRTFELSRRNRYEARPGKHDDRVMGWGIALQGLMAGPPNVGVHVL